jgi:hypothetical protein
MYAHKQVSLLASGPHLDGRVRLVRLVRDSGHVPNAKRHVHRVHFVADRG